jgi:hypothetical protein
MLFKNSVRTSKRTPYFTITEINWLTLFKFNVIPSLASLCLLVLLELIAPVMSGVKWEPEIDHSMLVLVASKALFISPLYLATAPSILSFTSSSGLVPLLLYISSHTVASMCCLCYRFHKHYRVPVFVISLALYHFKHWHFASSFHDVCLSSIVSPCLFTHVL